ncbi:MAG: MopE-related protein [Myxococcota bacterium]|nr:MopE-related protein [Myxococcota bacterium]
MKMVHKFCVLALLSTFIIACGDEETSRPSVTFPPTTSDMGTTMLGCSSSRDCMAGSVCVTGSCQPGVCAADVPCPNGMMCDTASRQCVNRPMNGCQRHEDCAMGFCIEGECRNVQCADDTHCQGNTNCINNECVERPRDCTDNDGDGFGVGADCGLMDCDDNDPNVNPNVIEDGQQRCGDGIDNNCDGVDVACSGMDRDGDGWTVERGDCDDMSAQVNPDQAEIPYNRIDDDCNERTSDTDVDRDGYDATAVGGMDCDDMNANINPEGRDIAGNGIDEDCDGADRVAADADGDMDGVTEAQGDCNDDDPTVNPNAVEIAYNGKDDDCDPNTPDDDLDRDGVNRREDCDDNNADRSPNNQEIYYNGIDDDCNPATADADADADGFNGGPRGTDCNDESAAVNPDAEEIPYNGVDDDCNGQTADDDLDNDGFIRANDCDDSNAEINPDVIENAMTNCDDGIDNNCNGRDEECQDEAPVDTDGDGVADDDDCEPNNPDIPGAFEIPNNGLDDDCDESTSDICEDDMFDVDGDNGEIETASVVEATRSSGIQYGGLRICPGDTDNYRIELAEGDGLEVDLTFRHIDGDIDMVLYRLSDDPNDPEPRFIAGSLSVTDNETVYLQRAPAAGTYVIQVGIFGFGSDASYGMTVHVFDQCIDDDVTDLARGYTGEQNDSADAAVEFPEPGSTRQICSYDDDWYTFELQRAEDVRIDVLFDHAPGQDIDVQIYDADNNRVAFSGSVNSNEVIETELDRGTYFVRVFGFSGSQNTYRLFRSAGQIGRARAEIDEAVEIPDPGEVRVPLTFADAPEGAVLRHVAIRDLVLRHSDLRNLRLTLLWDGQPLQVIWDQQGDDDGRDGGEDDDFLPFTGGDINFDPGPERTYSAFLGRPATGTLELLIEDLVNREEGDLTRFDVEIEYYEP